MAPIDKRGIVDDRAAFLDSATSAYFLRHPTSTQHTTTYQTSLCVFALFDDCTTCVVGVADCDTGCTACVVGDAA